MKERASDELELSEKEIDGIRKLNVWHKQEELTEKEKSQLVSQLVGKHQNTREKAEAIVNELDELIREERSEMDSIPQALGYSTKKVLISPNDIFNMIKRFFSKR